MKNLFIGTIAGLAMCAAALAQNTQPPSQATPSDPASSASTANNKIAPGSVIPVQLTKTVDAKKAKTGDQVVAMVTQDMRTQSGEVLVPKDTKVIGHVTEAQPRSKEQKESQLAIAFDQAVLKSGQVQMPMSIQAVVAPPQNNNDNPDRGGAQGTPAPGSPAGSTSSPMGGGRSPMGGGGQQQPQQPAPQSDDTGTSQTSRRPPINAQTQGVIGISNMTLASGSSPAQGSVLTSDKNNVKLETGTMLLLKVQ